MAIDPTRSHDIRSRAAEKLPEAPEATAPAKSAPKGRTDQVDISDEARALAQQSATDGIPVTQAHLAEVQDRLDSGFYEKPEVVQQVAERLMDSGDL